VTRSSPNGGEPIGADEDRVTDDLDRAELVESAGFQNTWAILGPASLILVPLSRLMAALWARVRRSR